MLITLSPEIHALLAVSDVGLSVQLRLTLADIERKIHGSSNFRLHFDLHTWRMGSGEFGIDFRGLVVNHHQGYNPVFIEFETLSNLL